MTDYERAMLRLECWKAIAGWGTRNPDAKELIDKLVTPWNWETRLKHADRLAEWAMKEPRS